jgi:ABC-type transport system involved in cytochrome c biogenesis permease subunit
METKYSMQGLLIYLTMGVYCICFLMGLAKLKKTANSVYLCGFAVAVISFIYRWAEVNHVPLQNLFEVFLSLGMILPSVTFFCKRVLNIQSITIDALLGIIVLFPAGFVFSDQPQHLPPALQSWLFAPHVAVYMIAYIFMAKAAFYAGGVFKSKESTGGIILQNDKAAYDLVCAGFGFLTIGLILGSVWGQAAWGDYWGWDPKEMWSLASWLVYAGYLHYRYMYGQKYPRINSIWVLTGMAVIIITLLWVNLSKLFAGLHSYAT